MAFEQRDNSGSLFINKRKEKDSHPDRTGECMIGGKKYRVAGWLKAMKSGPDKWLSLSFTPLDEDADRPGYSSSSQGNSRPAAGRDPGFDNIDDDIPF